MLWMTMSLAAAVTIPRAVVAPTIDDFVTMTPSARVASSVIKVGPFVQREPNNGQPATEAADAYLAYDADNFYAVFVCFDHEPAQIRGHMTRRENLTDEDVVTLYLDTFHDRQRAYAFTVNPAGVQQDAIWSENGGSDTTFDTVWRSQGRRTETGYVVWIAVPFKSIRFAATRSEWGLLLGRTIARKREETYWPLVSREQQGYLTQEASLTGLADVTPSRNIQLTPYALARSSRDIDFAAAAGPRFRQQNLASRTGIDSKFIVHNSLVVDATLNPDFSQVESDEPQVTVNQRFEVYFPEKRPFFLENSDYFQTAFADNSTDFFHLTSPLLFTRRIQDPHIGVRITGKLGANLVGLLIADDRAPGEIASPGSPLAGRRARFTVARFARDVAGNRLGAIVIERSFFGQGNRVAGVDGRFLLPHNWNGRFRATGSTDSGAVHSSGHTVDAELTRDDKHLFYDLGYFEASPGYVQRAGFYRRPDIRRVMQLARYLFRPEGKRVAWWGPMTYFHVSREFSGHQLDRNLGIELDAKVGRSTVFDIYTGRTDQTLRPVDYSTLPSRRTFVMYWTGGDISTQISRSVSLRFGGYHQGAINYDSPAGTAPFLTGEDYAKSVLTMHPTTALSIENTYIIDRLQQPRSGPRVFTNQIIRSKWNYQFTRSLSARVIAQYASVLAEPRFTSLATTKNLNGDFLISYTINPGTAFYLGYNGNLQNYDPALRLDPSGEILRTQRGVINDARQIFAKVSYQIRM